MLRIAAVPNKANVVIAFTQNPKNPIYAKNEREKSAALGPAESPVIRTMALMTTIHGVLTNSISSESSTVLIPYVIVLKRASPLITA